MRRMYLLCSGLVLLAIILTACGSKATPTEVAPPTPVVVTVVVTAPPTEVPPAEVENTPTLVAFNLAGPEMVVGKKYLYFNGSYLMPVPAGKFLMGRGGGTDNPEHEEGVADFWIFRNEVTNQQYADCVNQKQCTMPDVQDNPSYLDPARIGDPVTGVKWDQARQYCEYVHGRLPWETEWEKAAAWDPDNLVKYIYPWGDNAPSCALLNYNNCVGKTTNVMQYPQGESPYGLLDMAGNSYEWVGDWYDPFYYRNSPAENATGPDTGERRSIRSGGYRSNKDQVPSAVRFFDYPNNHSRDLGFRCVVEDPAYFAPLCEMLVYHGLDANGSPSSGGGYQDCPDPVIDHVGICTTGNAVKTNVKVHVAAPSYFPPGGITGLDAPGCLPGGNVPDLISACNSGITITAHAECDLVPPDGGPPCPDGWTLSPDGMSCQSEGGPGEACPEGYEYDPALHCCSTTPGNDAQTCIAGFHPFDGSCVPDIYGLIPPSDATWTTIDETTCGPNGYGALMEASPLYIALAKEQGQPVLAPVLAEEKAVSPLVSVSGFLTLLALGLVGWITRHGRKRS